MNIKRNFCHQINKIMDENVYYAHAGMLAFAVASIAIFSFWCAIVHPFETLFMTEATLYSHPPSTFLRLFANIFWIVPVAGTIAQSILGQQSFVDAYWTLCSYWNNYPNFVPAGYAWYVVITFLMIDVVTTLMFALMTTWANEDVKRVFTPIHQTSSKNHMHNHAFVIAAHNSSSILNKSLHRITAHVDGQDVYIADNGSTPFEEDATDIVVSNYNARCGHMSDIGSKTWAQFGCVASVGKKYKYVTIMDDDVLLPNNWDADLCNNLLQHDNNVAIAYPLRANNGADSIWARMQDLEYLLGDCERFAQDILGTNLFCSGAIATWRSDVLKKVLERHTTCFHGEDLTMGCIVHHLSGQHKLNDDPYHRIAIIKNCIVPTTVPICYAHVSDFLPHGLVKNKCKCGEASLFYQRTRSWDVANHSFLWKYIRVVFSRGSLFTRANMFARIFYLWKIIGIAREYLFIIGTFLYIGMNFDNILGLVIFTVDTLALWWGFVVWGLLLTNVKCLRKSHVMVQPEVMVLFPVLYMFLLTTVIRPISAFYNVFYYLPFVRFQKEIRFQTEKRERVLQVQFKSVNIVDDLAQIGV